MTNQEKMALLMQAYNAIFESKRLNTDIAQVIMNHPSLVVWNGQQWQAAGAQNGRWFVNNTVRGFDLNINAGNNKVIEIRILEQNVNKPSQYAVMARSGVPIAWVIDRKVKDGNAFLGRIQSGQWHASEPRATYPAAPGQIVYAPVTDISPTPSGVINMETLPEIPNQEAIPEAVYNSFADDDGSDIPEEILEHITGE